jgi:hypothetical protein
MGISRPTFGRIVESARRKVADALLFGKALRIEGGVVEWTGARRFRCRACGSGDYGRVDQSPPAEPAKRAKAPGRRAKGRPPARAARSR